MVNRFKKDVSYYLLGIIIPGGLNFAAIPVFKHLLGDAAYGKFNLLFTSLIVLNTALVGWIGHSFLRLSPASSNKQELSEHSLQISRYVTLAVLLPAALILMGLKLSWYEILLYLGILLLSSQQLTLTAIAQANFKARSIMVAESFRVTVFFFVGWLLLRNGSSWGVAKLLGASMLGYIVSIVLLRKTLEMGKWKWKPVAPAKIAHTAKHLMQYGLSLALWFLLNYCLQYADRYFLAIFFGNETSGNYSAVFDLISRSITVMSAPLLSASFPIITREFEAGNKLGVAVLLRKLVAIELLALMVSVAFYLFLGYDLLSKIVLQNAQIQEYQLCGLVILVGTFLFQLGMLFHKKLELFKNTRQMLICISLSLVISLLLNLVLTRQYGVIGASIAYLTSTASYLVLVSLSYPRNFLIGLRPLAKATALHGNEKNQSDGTK